MILHAPLATMFNYRRCKPIVMQLITLHKVRIYVSLNIHYIQNVLDPNKFFVLCYVTSFCTIPCFLRKLKK